MLQMCLQWLILLLATKELRCVDIDECRVANPCEQKCRNTPGSFVCSCRSGFQVVAGGGNEHRCQDVNECVLPGSCDHNCVNFVGGYRCSCRTGYRRQGTKCIKLYCARLQLPLNAQMKCRQASRIYGYNDKCIQTCNPGFYNKENPAIPTVTKTCLGNNNVQLRWSGPTISCEAKRCSEAVIRNLNNGQVLCNHKLAIIYGNNQSNNVCHFKCNSGYQLFGEKSTQCVVDSKSAKPNKPVVWSHLKGRNVKCSLIPKITCPTDVTYHLAAGSNKVTFPVKIQSLLKSNVQNVRASRNIGRTYNYGPGTHRVDYQATNDEDSLTSTCTWSITVIDKDPPQVTYCPQNVTLSTDMGNTWRRPEFKDNIGVAFVETNFKLPAKAQSRHYQFQYKATDAVGNFAFCRFQVTTQERKTCSSLKTGPNVMLNCATNAVGKFCTARCNQTLHKMYEFYFKPEFLYSCGSDGKWGPTDNVPGCFEAFKEETYLPCTDNDGYVRVNHWGANICVRCPPGSAQGKNDKTKCKLCKRGYYATKDDVICQKCSKGTTQKEGAKSDAECFGLCPAGTFSKTGDAKDVCKDCPVNTYSDKKGEQSCTTCPPGTSTNGKTKTDKAELCVAPLRMSPATLALNNRNINTFGTVSLTCEAFAAPKPNITWEEISPGGRKDLGSDFARSETTLGNGFVRVEVYNNYATPSDSGTYMCTAKTQSESKTISVRVKVEEFRRKK